MFTKKVHSKGLIDYFKQVIARRRAEQLSVFNYDIALKHLEIFSKGTEIPFNELSPTWFLDFRFYLSNATGLRSSKPLSHNSVNTYFRITVLIAKGAADSRLVDHQILTRISNTKRILSKNCSLSIDELQCLAKTPCRIPALKNAFMFSALTGLQWKEISKLQWHDISQIEGALVVTVVRNCLECIIPLNTQALDLLGLPGKPTDQIFSISYTAALCANLKIWALQAGVLRNVTFNSARLTFGKMLLDNKVPLELVSELLGHRNIATTQKLFGKGYSAKEAKIYLRAFSI